MGRQVVSQVDLKLAVPQMEINNHRSKNDDAG